MIGGRFGCGLRVAQRIFSSNKSLPANRKNVFYTIRLSKNEEIGGIFVFSDSGQKFFEGEDINRKTIYDNPISHFTNNRLFIHALTCYILADDKNPPDLPHLKIL